MAFVMKDEIFAELKNLCCEMYETGETLSCEKALMKLMDMDGIPMHCPYHHFIMPAALQSASVCLSASIPEEVLFLWKTGSGPMREPA